MTKSTPVSSYILLQETASMTSPLPMTGMDTASFTLRIISQSALGAYICWRVRPWMHSAAAPFSSMILANSTALTEFSSQPLRNFTVTGSSTAEETALTISPASFGFFINALPPPFPATLGAGQPMLMSMMSGLNFKVSCAACAIICGSSPKIWIAAGRSFSERVNNSSVLLP